MAPTSPRSDESHRDDLSLTNVTHAIQVGERAWTAMFSFFEEVMTLNERGKRMFKQTKFGVDVYGVGDGVIAVSLPPRAYLYSGSFHGKEAHGKGYLPVVL